MGPCSYAVHQPEVRLVNGNLDNSGLGSAGAVDSTFHLDLVLRVRLGFSTVTLGLRVILGSGAVLTTPALQSGHLTGGRPRCGGRVQVVPQVLQVSTCSGELIIFVARFCA
jgi:hypothetical protein